MSTLLSRCCLTVAAYVALAILAGGPVFCEDMSTIIAMWNERQNEATGLVVEWNEYHEEVDVLRLKSWARDRNRKEIGKVTRDSEVFGKLPTIKYEQHKMLKVNATCYRYSFRGSRPINGIEQPQELDIAMDGSRHVQFSPSYERNGHPGAIVHKASKPLAPNNSYLPIVLVERPFDERFGGLNATQLSMVGKQELVDGIPCVAVESRRPGTQSSMMLWLDPSLQFMPLRVSTFNGAELTYQLDLKYDRTTNLNGPLGWRSVSYAKGLGPQSIVVANVEKWRLSESLATSDFAIEFPVGTTVSDFLGEQERNYIVQNAETKREVLKEEMALPHEVLMNTQTGRADEGSRTSLVWVTVVVALVVVAGIICRYRFA